MRRLKAIYGVDPTKSGFFNPSWTQKKKELMDVRRGDPVTFHSTYQGKPSEMVGNVFLESDFKYFMPIGDLSLGIQDPAIKKFVQDGLYLIQAWDTAYSEKRTADYSVCITGLLWPCEEYHRPENDPLLIGECEPHFDLYILDLYRELLDFPNLTKAIKEQRLKWLPQHILIEEKVSGISAIQVLKSAGIYVEGVKSVEGKRARATTTVGTGSAQGWLRLHRVLFPYGAPWLEVFKRELLGFDGSGNGYDDQVDALVTATIHTILASAGGQVIIGSTAQTPQELIDSKPEFLTMLGSDTLLDTSVFDPTDQTCKKCVFREGNYCNFQNRKVILLDSCYNFTSERSDIRGW